MSSIDIDTYNPKDDIVYFIRLNKENTYVENIEYAKEIYNCQYYFDDFSKFVSFFKNEFVKIIVDGNIYKFDVQTFPWEKIPAVIAENYVIDFGKFPNIHLQLFLLEHYKDDILDLLSKKGEFRYYVDRTYTTRISIFERESFPCQIKSQDTFFLYIETLIRRNCYALYSDGFEMIIPCTNQSVIDALPRFYDYKCVVDYMEDNTFFSTTGYCNNCIFDSCDDSCHFYEYAHCERSKCINLRVRILDNGNNSITLKCFEKDIYNYAIECINITINKCCMINPINDSIYHFYITGIDNMTTGIKWIKQKMLPLSIKFTYEDRFFEINRKIKSINSSKIISKYMKEVDGKKLINGIIFDENSILIEFDTQ